MQEEGFMNLDRYPLWVISLGVFLMVLAAMEGGYRLGGVERRRPEFEKEAPVSAISGSILGLLAFMLAFTFGIVASRFDDRKELVREEANTIRTVIARSEFLPEGDRGRAVGLLKTYLALRLEIVSKRNMITIERNLSECGDIQKDLWRMAVANARKDMNSDVAALYVEALNDMAAFHAKRVSLGLKTRVPAGIWLVLCALMVIGMATIGYQTAIASSRRSPAAAALSMAFTLVISLITALDNPHSDLIRVPQQPLSDLLGEIRED